MTMDTSQAAIWKQITQVYEQWDQGQNALMPLSELNEKLPAVAPELVKDAVVQAANNQEAEFASAEDEGAFKPLRT
jgi:hypothetical protein